MKFGIGLGVLCLLAAAPAAAQVWVEGAGRSCDAACNASGLSAMASGTYANGQPYYMCAADALGEGYRGGFNLRPDWANTCTVGAGGREVSSRTYSCLCVATAGLQPGAGPVRQQTIMPAPVVQPSSGSRRVRITEASYGLNCGMPRGNATAHVTRWCDRAEDICDYTIDPGVFGAADSCQADFSVTYRCGSDGRPKVAQSRVTGVRGQIVLTCP